MRKNITLNILFIFKRINKLSLVSFLVLFNSLYPIDPLNTSIDKGNVPQKAALHIIGKWQILSNNCDVLNCQFYPSCSNYMSRSIIEFGIFNGTVVGLDRIIRCNPAAIGYHLSKDNPRFYSDGRLIDLVPYDYNIRLNSKFSYYSIIPGYGRFKSGRRFDGLISSITIFSSMYIANTMIINENYLTGSLFTVIGFLFWWSDFYGSSNYHYNL